MTANFGFMLGALLLCLVLSAFFSAAETAFATVNRIRLKVKKFVYYKLIFKVNTDGALATVLGYDQKVRFASMAK